MKQPNSSVPRRADPGGLQAQLCQTHGYIALGTGGADAEVLHIAQAPTLSGVKAAMVSPMVIN